MTSPQRTQQQAARPLRGGAFNNDADNLRAAYRNRNDADNRNDNIGFRVAARPPNTLLAPAPVLGHQLGRPFGHSNHLPLLTPILDTSHSAMPRASTMQELL